MHQINKFFISYWDINNPKEKQKKTTGKIQIIM